MDCKTFLIDDDPISALLTEHVLKLENFSQDITTFQRAEEALAYLIENTAGELPAVILLDLNMPVVSGWDFLDALKPYQHLLPAGLKIFILTSSLDTEDQIRSKEYSLVTGFIQKPLCPDDIQFIQAGIEKSARS